MGSDHHQMGDMEHGYFDPDPSHQAKVISETASMEFKDSMTLDSESMVPMESNPLHQTL